jgi:hypothetical protein
VRSFSSRVLAEKVIIVQPKTKKFCEIAATWLSPDIRANADSAVSAHRLGQ